MSYIAPLHLSAAEFKPRKMLKKAVKADYDWWSISFLT